MALMKTGYLLLIFFGVCFVANPCSAIWNIEVIDVGNEDLSLAMDTNGNPHISYSTKGTIDEVRYAWKETIWHWETVAPHGDPEGDNAIALDSNNRPHIAYFDDINDDLNYAYKQSDGSWVSEKVDTRYRSGMFPSISIDTSNRPHISYLEWDPYDRTSDNLKYAYKDGNTWTIQIIDGLNPIVDLGWFTSIDLDNSNNPHISYFDWTNAALKYAWFNGTWHIKTVDTVGQPGRWSSIKLDRYGHPHIAYYQYWDGSLKYAEFDGVQWFISIVDSGASGTYCSLTLDREEKPHISYSKSGSLGHAWFDNGWHTEIVEGYPLNGVGGTSIAIDKFGNPCIAYFNRGVLKYAWLERDDSIPPVTTLTLNNTPTIEEWYAREVHVIFTAVDNEGGSGIQNISYSLDGTNWITYTRQFIIDSEGQVILWFKSVDNAGNEEEPHSLIFNIDTTPPVTTCTLEGIIGDNGWYISNVTVTLEATDVGSGVKKTEYSFNGNDWITYSEPFIVTTEGLTTLYYRSEDNAGIVEVSIEGDNVKIDKFAPITTETHSGTPSTGYTVSFSSSGGSSSETIQYSSDGINWHPYEEPLSYTNEGTWTVYYRTIDSAGNIESPQRIDIIIDKTPPNIFGSATPSPNENGWYRTDVTVHFEASDAVSGLKSVTPNLILTSDGEGQSVIGTAEDNAGNTASYTVTGINIDKTSPIVDSIQYTLEPYPVNSPVQVNVVYTELHPDKAIIDWGDGSLLEEISLMGSTSPTISSSHSYTIPSIYTVTVSVLDLAGNSGSLSSTEYIVIYDPNGGFVTGGGWISSPSGAYTLDPSLTGKAIFGFVSKYQKGANVPTGQTEFQFKTGNLNFKSSSYDWLVVAGPKAQYKGVGTINNAGEFRFMLTAIDGAINGGGGMDKFRIKIWDKATDAVVYDNQMGASDTSDPTTIIGGGSIVIHK